jgi:hypothetical protein
VEEPGPALVVEVVPCAAVVRPEAGDGAVDDAVRHVACTDAESLGDAGPESLQHDVRLCADRAPELRIAFEIPDDGFLAGVECLVPAGRHVAHRIPARRLDADDARAPL